MRISGAVADAKTCRFAGINPSPHDSPQVWKDERLQDVRPHFPRLSASGRAVDNRRRASPRILALRLGRDRSSSLRPSLSREPFNEAHLPAKRTPAEAQARLPCPDEDPRRPCHPEAPPREGPQAPFGVDGAPRLALVQRKNRLSRSRDFDTVYRQGRSVSTRFLTLYWFAARRGAGRAAARARGAEGGRLERRRATGSSASCARSGRSKLDVEAVAPTNDYVLVVRPGLPEAAETRGHDWLVERVDEVLGKVAA